MAQKFLSWDRYKEKLYDCVVKLLGRDLRKKKEAIQNIYHV